MEKAVFVAYPYKIEGYRESIARACTGLATPFYADNELLGSHVLDKIRNQMQRADLCLFDLSGRNFNVALELGIAMALELNYRVLICENDLPEPADLGGWDQLRYENLVDLSLRLRDRLHSPEIFQTHRRSISVRSATRPTYSTPQWNRWSGRSLLGRLHSEHRPRSSSADSFHDSDLADI
jgi:hypothetical protein